MLTKGCCVIHGRLTSERKASTSPSSFINHSILLLERERAPAPSPLSLHALKHSTGSERVDETRSRRVYHGLHAVEVMINHCMITRDFSVISIDVIGVSLSLSLSLSLALSLSLSPSLSLYYYYYYSQKSLKHNIGSASALPRMCTRRKLALQLSPYNKMRAEIAVEPKGKRRWSLCTCRRIALVNAVFSVGE